MSRNLIRNVCAIFLLFGIIKAGKATSSSNGGSAAAHFEPQVAALCDPGASYHPQFMNDQGRWETDLTTKPTPGSSCMKDKMDILDYCKKVYPTRDITNIVEASHYLKVGGWCRLGISNPAKCKAARWVKPFRCLEGPFQSDALLVPESCLFDHIHNQSHCWQFSRWNVTAGRACQERGLQLRSFAMLLPCGISLFSGVEFVCCPKHFKDNLKVKKPIDLDLLKPESDLLSKDEDILADDGAGIGDNGADDILDDDVADDDDDDDTEDMDEDDEDQEMSDEPVNNRDEDDIDETSDVDTDDVDDDYDDDTATGESRNVYSDVEGDNFGPWDDATPAAPTASTSTPSTTTSSTTTTTTPAPTTSTAKVEQTTQDPYFAHYDPRIEHQSFKDAQQRLEENHREKVSKVMKEWGSLEERYQEMRAQDPRGAAGFKRRMASKFQAGVRALERAGAAEQRRLAALHQQRVLAHIAQRRRDALVCYERALSDIPPNTHRVQKCLQKLLRALHKDRAHALAHYRHLLAGSPEAAATERSRTLERLVDIDRTVNHSMQMLKRYPDLYNKIGQLMDDYIQALRSKDETPGSMLSMTPEAEAAILDKYKAEMEHRIAEKEKIKAEERLRKEQRGHQRTSAKQERQRVEAVLGKKMAGTFEQESLEDDDDVDESLLVLPRSDEQQVQSSSHSSISTPSIQPSSAPASSAAPSAQPVPSSSAGPAPSQATPTQLYASDSSNTQDSLDDLSSSAWYSSSAPSLATVDDVAVQRIADEAAAATRIHQDPAPAHAMVHDIGHGEPSYTVRREVYGGSSALVHGGRGFYLAACVGLAAVLGAVAIGVAVVRRRNAVSPHAMGFVEVDQTGPCVPPTPEERHVANMQINGYENPTYKYFEVKE